MNETEVTDTAAMGMRSTEETLTSAAEPTRKPRKNHSNKRVAIKVRDGQVWTGYGLRGNKPFAVALVADTKWISKRLLVPGIRLRDREPFAICVMLHSGMHTKISLRRLSEGRGYKLLAQNSEEFAQRVNDPIT